MQFPIWLSECSCMTRAVGWVNAQSPWLQDNLTNTSDTLQWRPSLPITAWLVTKDFLCPCPLFYYSLCHQSWSSSALTESKPETPFKVTSPTCVCHNPLSWSQQSFNPWLCTSTSTATKFLHSHHTHRLRDTLNSAADTGWFALIPNLASWNPSLDLEPQARVQVSW